MNKCEIPKNIPYTEMHFRSPGDGAYLCSSSVKTRRKESSLPVRGGLMDPRSIDTDDMKLRCAEITLCATCV